MKSEKDKQEIAAIEQELKSGKQHVRTATNPANQYAG